MSKLGITIINAVKRGLPILQDGTQVLPKNFSLKNPYILEALPETKLAEISIFEGKKLETVARILDDANYTDIYNRYFNLINKKTNFFTEEELSLLCQKAFGGKKLNPLNDNIDASIYLNSLDWRKAELFDAHGIAKDSIPQQLKQLNEILSNGIGKNRNFFTAPLDVNPANARGVGAGIGTAGGCAYRDGSFILVSDKRKTLKENGIKSVIVNDVYYNIIDDLQRKFPNIKFLRADEASKYYNNL